MRVAEVIGKLTLSTCHPSVRGGSWRIAVPLSLEGLKGADAGRGEPYVVYDDLGSSTGAQIAVSEGAEAAAPFHPNPKPIDAYNSALIDHLELD